MTKDNEMGVLRVRNGYVWLSIPYESIMYIKSNKYYSTIHTPREKIVTNTPFKVISRILPKRLFIRTHTEYLVAISQIEVLEPNRITLLNEDKVMMSKTYRDGVLKLLNDLGIIEGGF
jgi:DNA-binding LytR/AlgR family response regulator